MVCMSYIISYFTDSCLKLGISDIFFRSFGFNFHQFRKEYIFVGEFYFPPLDVHLALVWRLLCCDWSVHLSYLSTTCPSRPQVHPSCAEVLVFLKPNKKTFLYFHTSSVLSGPLTFSTFSFCLVLSVCLFLSVCL